MNWTEPAPAPEHFSLPDLHPLVRQALARRGFRSTAEAEAFLFPEKYTPHPASEIPGLSQTAEIVMRAVKEQTQMCVWGDFDVDGQTSTTILWQTLKDLGANVTYHIPVRAEEGHGIRVPALKKVLEEGARLILTCDTGISEAEAGNYLSECGVELVITDHHSLPQKLPKAAAITNPHFLPEGHPLATLAGAGVAYKLAEELYAQAGMGEKTEELLDLACLGLVADLAVLVGDARYIVQRGLESLRHTRRLGLQVMYETARLNPEMLNEEHIGYEIGPRLNALGRLGDANPAVDFFTTTDSSKARVLASQLEGLNAQRQLLCKQVSQAAEDQLRKNPALLEEPVLVLWGREWEGGVVGIAASHLVERYHKPAILLSLPEEGPAHGSARSVEGVDITKAIAATKDLLLHYGGHPMAAGLALEREKVAEFRQRLAAEVRQQGGGVSREGELTIDGQVNLGEVSPELAEALEAMAPFGHGNEALVLTVKDLSLKGSTPMGRNKEHVKLTVQDQEGNEQKVLWWNGGEANQPTGRFDLAFKLRNSDWRGKQQTQMELIDFHLVNDGVLELKAGKLEVIDHRLTPAPWHDLERIRNKGKVMVWAEGEEKRKIGAKDRTELGPAEELVIWTTPASPDELRQALEIVRPGCVHLFAIPEPVQAVEAFVERLAGLLKYVLRAKNGKTTWTDLAAATAQREITVRKGVEWLAAQGKIGWTADEAGGVQVSAGTSRQDAAAGEKAWKEVQTLVTETEAFRKHFRAASKDTLIEM
jgi:single-stranded-DNA-specific exonuclease